MLLRRESLLPITYCTQSLCFFVAAVLRIFVDRSGYGILGSLPVCNVVLVHVVGIHSRSGLISRDLGMQLGVLNSDVAVQLSMVPAHLYALSLSLNCDGALLR